MSQIERITILGGTGFLGQRLAARLVKDGYHLRIPTRRREENRELLVLPGVELVQADTHNVDVMREVLQGSDVVINLIGILNENRTDTQKFKVAHVDITRNALAVCEELGISRYLHMSALKADAETSPSEYLRSKGASEALVHKSSLNTTVFRPSLIFGVGDSFINRFAKLLSIPSPVFMLPAPNARFAPVFVDDVIEAIQRSIKDRDTYNKRYSCCGPKIYSMRELVQLIADHVEVNRKIVGLGPLLSKLAANVLGLMPGKPFTKDNYFSMQVNSICEANGLSKLNIKPKSLESVIPTFHKSRNSNDLYSRFRRTAGR